MTEIPSSPLFAFSAFIDAGVAAWPSLSLDRDGLERRAKKLAGPRLAHAGDFALACACADRNERAIRLLEPLLRAAVAAAVAKIDPSPSFADDVGQQLRERLLLADPPTITSYGARATLRTWLRMAALRAALNMRRRREDDVRTRSALTSSCSTTPGEADLAYLRTRYKDEFAAVVKDVVARLPPRERRILRGYAIENATLEALAASYGVSISTVARWLTSARERLARDIRSDLRERLAITSSEFEGIAHLVRSDLDVSLAGLLKTPAPSVRA